MALAITTAVLVVSVTAVVVVGLVWTAMIIIEMSIFFDVRANVVIVTLVGMGEIIVVADSEFAVPTLCFVEALFDILVDALIDVLADMIFGVVSGIENVFTSLMTALEFPVTPVSWESDCSEALSC